MRRTLAGVAVIALMVTGCSSNDVAEGSDPGWVSSNSAIAGVNGRGASTAQQDSFSGTKQVITENPATEEPLGGELILCGGIPRCSWWVTSMNTGSRSPHPVRP